MKNKMKFMAVLLGMLFVVQAAQAQSNTTVRQSELKIDRSKIVVDATRMDLTKIKIAEFKGVSGTITLPKPLPAAFQNIQCSQIEVLIGETVQGQSSGAGIAVPMFKATANTNATGTATSGKCAYRIPNPQNANTGKKLEIRIQLNTEIECKTVSSGTTRITATAKSVTYPTAAVNEIVNFDAKFDCIYIN